MRDRFTVAKREATVQVPAPVFTKQLQDERTTKTDDGYTYRPPAKHLLAGFGTRRTEWTVSRVSRTTVTETVKYGQRWYGLVLLGVVVVFGGRVLALGDAVGTEAVATVLGLAMLLAATAVVLPRGTLPRKKVSLEALYYPQIGPLTVVWLGSLAGIGVDGTPGMVVASAATLAWVGHGRGRQVEVVCSGLSRSLSEYVWRVPALPTRYVLTMATATTALGVFIASNVRLSVPNPSTGAFGVIATALVAVVALSLGDSRRRARIGVLIAATVSGVFVFSLPLWISAVVRPLSVASPLQHALLGATTVLLVAAWGGFWYALFSAQALARDRFLDAGREITTPQAAVSAYLMITTAGCFLATTLGSLAVAWHLLERAAPGSVWLLAAGLALPAAYLVAGSLYQLGQLAAMVWQIRTRSDQQPDLNDLDLPFEPVQPVWILDEETFYAGAYWDPFDHAIVVSSGAVETLDAHELAVIVAHEESHFEYWGAHLQFAFAVLPAFALMGKNVVYSIYDFRERELTADAYALQRLEDALDDDAPEVVVSVLQRFLRNEFDELEGSVLTFLPTLQTTAAAQGAKRALDVVFEAFYGHYAGNVHPSNDERIRAIRARANAEAELSPTERPDGDGDTGPADRQVDDVDTSPSDRPDADAD